MNASFYGAQRQRQNIGSATIAGFEAEATVNLARGFSVRGGYLFSSAINDDTELRLPQVPRNQGNIGMGYDGALQFTADVRFIGDAFENDLNTFVLPRYGVLDMSVRVPLSPKFRVYVAVENLLDEEYVVRADPLEIIGTPRMVHGGIELRLFE